MAASKNMQIDFRHNIAIRNVQPPPAGAVLAPLFWETVEGRVSEGGRSPEIFCRFYVHVCSF